MGSESRRRRQKRICLVVLACCVAATLAGGAIAAWALERVSVCEFSPDLFRYRTHIYWQWPLVGVRVWSTEPEQYSSPFLEYLHKEGFVSDENTVSDRWSLVSGHKSPVDSWEGYAMRFRRVDNEKVLEWSKSNPEKARILLPILVDLVRRERYSIVELLVMQREASVPTEGFEDFLRRAASIYSKAARP